MELDGETEFLWFCGFIHDRQHQFELTEIQLGIKADVRRLQEVDQRTRPDMEIVCGLIIPLEHECSERNRTDQIIKKMDAYGDRLVLWTCHSLSYLDRLGSLCPSDRHRFTLFDHARRNFHGDIWVDRKGNRKKLTECPHTDAHIDTGDHKSDL